MEYSVLMSVYKKENAKNLKESMESIYNQTVSTNDFVLVCDGPLTDELNMVIEDMEEKFSKRLNVIRLKENGGLGKALNIGVGCCKNELIARMDSDDIAYLDRCERQLKVFEKYKNISICSGIVEEFSNDINNIEARRIVPEYSDEISAFAKKRNPFNHPCVMYKKSAVINSGSYQDFYLLEDYYLWLRMLSAGFQGYNIQEPLLYMRAGRDMYKRRAGIKYVLSQEKLLRFMKNEGIINNFQYFQSLLIRSFSTFLPNFIRIKLFGRFMRQ